jgi:hypothetical protein
MNICRNEAELRAYEAAEKPEPTEAEIQAAADVAFERLCRDQEWVWEAIGPEALPNGLFSHKQALRVTAQDIGQAILDDDKEKLGEAIMDFARAYLLEAARDEAEKSL